MNIDWTINVGNIITAGALLLGLLAAHIQNSRRLQDIETKVGMLWKAFEASVLRTAREREEE